MTETVIFDLDGTILNVYDRYYQVLLSYLKYKSFQVKMFDFEEYIKLKKKGVKDHLIVEILSGQRIDIQDYVVYKKENLEAIEFLRKDKVIGNPYAIMQQLKEAGIKTILLTQRRNTENTLLQLEKLKLINIFDHISIVKPSSKNAKMEWIEAQQLQEVYIIGDGPLELECVQKVGCEAYFVNTGLSNFDNIHYNCHFCDNYMQAVSIILKKVEGKS